MRKRKTSALAGCTTFLSKRGIRRFQRQTVLILLDTMDVITGKTVLDNDHLFLQENGNIWRALGQASSWVQAERNYNALEEMESKLH